MIALKKAMIELSALIPVGKTESKLCDGILHMTTTRAIHDVGYNIRRDCIKSYMQMPGSYRLPMRIDLDICLDTPELLLLVGEGHVSFGSPWMENRRIEDIAAPNGKARTYDNSIPFGRFVELSVIYNFGGMQILVDGEERYFSKRERYGKAEDFAGQNAAGFALGITCTKRAELSIRSIAVTESDSDLPFEPHAAKEVDVPAPAVPQKPTFDSCTQDLPDEIRQEIVDTERHLKSLPNLKFKRTLEKHGNKITYVASAQGISYALYLSGNLMHHSFQWYLITNSKPEEWHRKANPMEEVLEEIAGSAPGLAERVFYNLNECVGCREGCLARTVYSFGGQKKATCHGQVFYKMKPSEFQDIRDFFTALNSYAKD